MKFFPILIIKNKLNNFKNKKKTKKLNMFLTFTS